VAGGIKLLLRCLQSIQCQYYLVFGVVKTVPLQSFARLRFPFRPSTPIITASFLALRAPKCLLSQHSPLKTDQQQHRERSSIHIYCIYSVYVVPLLFIPHACAFHPDLSLSTSSNDIGIGTNPLVSSISFSSREAPKAMNNE